MLQAITSCIKCLDSCAESPFKVRLASVWCLDNARSTAFARHCSPLTARRDRRKFDLSLVAISRKPPRSFQATWRLLPPTRPQGQRKEAPASRVGLESRSKVASGRPRQLEATRHSTTRARYCGSVTPSAASRCATEDRHSPKKELRGRLLVMSCRVVRETPRGKARRVHPSRTQPRFGVSQSARPVRLL
jgi:hypothetical protein